MKKIIHIEDFFHPDAGYQVNILAKYLAKEDYEVYIIAAEFEKLPDYLTKFFGKEEIEKRDLEYSQKYNVNIIRIPLKAYISGRAIYSKRIWKVIKEINPDIVYVHGCDTYIGMQVLRKSSKINYKIITDNHMVDIASKNPLRGLFRAYYRLMVTPYIKKHNIPVLRMVNDEYVEKRLGIPLTQAPIISFGSDTMLFTRSQKIKLSARTELGIDRDDFVICYAGKLDEFKRGKFLAETLVEKFNTKRNLVFLVIGSTNGEYGAEVEKLFSKSENKILRFPTQKYEDLARFYQVSDVAVFPHACSLSFFDVQSCGLPVISEEMDINIERCSHGNGLNFKEGSMESFRNAIITIANMEDEKFEQMINNSVEFIRMNYDYSRILGEYLQVL